MRATPKPGGPCSGAPWPRTSPGIARRPPTRRSTTPPGPKRPEAPTRLELPIIPLRRGCRLSQRRNGSGLGLAGVLLLCAGAARGAAPPAEPDPASRTPPTPIPTAVIETTTSELVLIEVYVRDKDGSAVKDLTPADVVLKIDQQVAPKPIVSLEWVEPPPAVLEAAA